MSTLNQQAKVGSAITHVDTSGGMWGMALGIAGGVAIVYLTGGGGIIVLVTAGASGGGIGKSIGEMVIDPAKGSVEGHISDGSPDTFIGADRKKAARAAPFAPKTLVDCHGGEYVAQGSDTVFINRCSSSRKRDGTSCGGFILDGDETIFTGGVTTTLFEFGILPMDKDAEAYWWMGMALEGAGLLGGMPASGVGKVLYLIQAASYAESLAAGPGGETGIFNDIADATSLPGGIYGLATSASNPDTNKGKLAMSATGVVLKLLP